MRHQRTIDQYPFLSLAYSLKIILGMNMKSIESAASIIEIDQNHQLKIHTNQSSEKDPITQLSQITELPNSFLANYRSDSTKDGYIYFFDLKKQSQVVRFLSVSKTGKISTKRPKKIIIEREKDKLQLTSGSIYYKFVSRARKLEYRCTIDMHTSELQFLKIDLSDFEGDQFECRLLSEGTQPKRFDIRFMEAIVDVYTHRISSRRTCIMNCEDQLGGSTGLRKPTVDLLGNISDRRLRSRKEGLNDMQLPFRPYFLFGYDPTLDKRYKNYKQRLFQSNPQFEEISTNLYLGTLRVSKSVAKTKFREFWGTESHHQRFMTLVYVLSNKDLVLKVFDFRNKKILKTTFLSVLEILKQFGFRNKFHVKRLFYRDLILNPFDGSLYVTFWAMYLRLNPLTINGREELIRIENLGEAYSPELVKHNQFTQEKARTCFIRIGNIFDEMNRTFEPKTYNCTNIPMTLCKDSLLLWKEGNSLEIEQFSLRGEKRRKIVLDAQDRFITNIINITELDDDKLVLSNFEGVFVITKEPESKILDQKVLTVLFNIRNQESLASSGDLLLRIFGHHFSLYKLSNQGLTRNNEKKSPPSKIEHLMDQSFYEICPKFGDIKTIIDFRTQKNASICSLLFEIDYYTTESRLEYGDKIFHCLVDYEAKRILSYSMVEAIPPECIRNNLEFGHHYEFYLDSGGNLMCESNSKQHTLCWARLAEKIPGGEISLTQLENTEGYYVNHQGYTIYSLTYKVDRGDYYVVEADLLETKKSANRSIKLFKKECLRLGSSKAYEIPLYEIRIENVIPEALHVCKTWNDKVRFKRDSNNQLRILVLSFFQSNNSMQRKSAVSSFTILDPRLKVLYEINFTHDLERPIDRESSMLFKVVGDGKLLLSYMASVLIGGSLVERWRSFVLDAESGQVHRLRRLRSDFKSDVFWANGRDLMIYRLDRVNQQSLGIYHLGLD